MHTVSEMVGIEEEGGHHFLLKETETNGKCYIVTTITNQSGPNIFCTRK